MKENQMDIQLYTCNDSIRFSRDKIYWAPLLILFKKKYDKKYGNNIHHCQTKFKQYAENIFFLKIKKPKFNFNSSQMHFSI